VTFPGAYREADGRRRRGQSTVAITFGKNKDHRPDLKQLLWSLTATVDGMVPIHYRVYDGNTNDSPTHWDTWTTVRTLVGRPDFLYVADSKLCAEGVLQRIAAEGGRFLTVCPRTRKEDGLFREWVQTHPVPWEEVDRRATAWGEPDVWSMAESPIPAADGFRLVWIWSTGMARVEREAREEMMGRALKRVRELDLRLQNPRSRYRLTEAVRAAAEREIGPRASRWVEVELREESTASYRQAGPGRPGSRTDYRRVERKRFRVEGRVREDRLTWDGKQDGMFPLLTNGRDLSLAQLLEAYRWQPTLEKRHEQLKSVYSVAPVFLKKVTRIEGLLFVYFLALLTEALLEREVRRGMVARGLKAIPLYPEARPCEAPTADRVLEAFAGVSRYRLVAEGREIQVFEPELSAIQRQLLELIGVPEEVYRGAP
jgi:transposase